MAFKTRLEVRTALGTGLDAALVGTGLPVTAFYDYLKQNFTEAPVVCIATVGTEQQDETIQGTFAQYLYNILVYVARGSSLEEEAEDALDDIADRIYDYIVDNRNSTNWQKIERAGESSIVADTVGGNPYWVEIHPIRVYSY